jgi:hypothetical protein
MGSATPMCFQTPVLRTPKISNPNRQPPQSPLLPSIITKTSTRTGFTGRKLTGGNIVPGGAAGLLVFDSGIGQPVPDQACMAWQPALRAINGHVVAAGQPCWITTIPRLVSLGVVKECIHYVHNSSYTQSGLPGFGLSAICLACTSTTCPGCSLA